MRKLVGAIILIFITLITCAAYQILQDEWVTYHLAQNYFAKKNYSKAIDYYLLSLEKGIKPQAVLNHLVYSCAEMDEYQMTIEVFNKLIQEDPDDVQLIIALGNFYIKINQGKKALKLYEQAMRILPNDVVLRLGYAQALLIAKEYQKAEVEYRYVIDNYDEDILLLPLKWEIEFELVQVYLFQNEYGKAVDILNSLLDENGHINLKIQLVNIYIEQKNYDKALEVVGQIPFWRLDQRSRLVIAELFVYKKNYNMAIYMYTEYLKFRRHNLAAHCRLAEIYVLDKNYKSAERQLKFVLKHKPNDIQVRAKLAFCYLRQKKFEKAEEQFQIIASIYPQSIDTVVPADAQISEDDLLMARAYVYIRKKDYFAAGNILRHMRLYPKSDAALLRIARIFRSIKQYPRAIAAYYRVVTRENFHDAAIFMEFADTYLEIEDVKNANYYYKQAFLLEPQNSTYKKKYAVTSLWLKKYQIAELLLLELQKELLEDIDVKVELARLYVIKKDFVKANEMLANLIKQYPGNLKIFNVEAEYYMALGSYFKAKELYDEIVQRRPDSLQYQLAAVEVYNAIGDFYTAERVYLAMLLQFPNQKKIKLKLAELYISSERYEEAEAIYLTLLEEKKNIRDLANVYKEYSLLKLKQKDYSRALYLAYFARDLQPKTFNYIVNLAKIYAAKKEYKKAVGILKKFPAKSGSYFIEKNLLIGKYQVESEDYGRGKKTLKKVLEKDPQKISALFYYNFPNEVRSEEFLDFIKGLSFMEIKEMADLFLEEHMPDTAIGLYQEALEKNNNYFPAKMQLVMALAERHEYQEALFYDDEIIEEFPNDYKALLWKARMLAWSKHYSEAIEIYKHLHQLNRDDPVIIRELARCYLWDRNLQMAKKTYDLKLYPGVETKTLANYADYMIQRSMRLEKEAQVSFYEGKMQHALHAFEKLVEFEKFNQEALYTLGQTECILGLKDRAIKSYEKLLALDARHNLAKKALEMTRIKTGPYLQARHNYYNEEGRGVIDRVIQNQTNLTAGLFIRSRDQLRASFVRWNDKPTYFEGGDILNQAELSKESYDAYGYKIAGDFIFNTFIKMEADFTQKYYTKKFSCKNLGYLHFWFDCEDYVDLGIGYDRFQLVDNYFSLTNDIRTDNFWLKLNTGFEDRLDLKFMAEYDNYSDNNYLLHDMLEANLKLFGFPQIVKFGLMGEYRNMPNMAIYHYTNGFLSNLIHPYWTPKHYYAGRISLEWHGDFSKDNFCSGDVRYLEMRIAAQNDTEKNPALILEGKVHLEFLKHWQIEARGLIHRSHLWNSDQLDVHLRYQF